MVLLSRVIRVLVIAIAGIFISLNCQAATTTKLLVLYPQISPAYDQIFLEIIAGIESHPASTHSVVPVLPATTPQTIASYVSQNNVDAIIALGKQTYDLAHGLRGQLPVVHGGLMLNPDDHSGISLAGAPEQFFAHLTEIAPGVKRVFTVYNEENSGWIIRLAQQSARAHNIELKAYAANDIREAVQKFRGILEQAKDSSDAIWLLLDNILPDKTIMPMALETAWQRRVVLFSNNPSHTRRGALFALFPDHQQMGYSLANLATKKAAERPRQPLVIPLSDLKVSLNRRTASHLGLNYSKPAEEEIDADYPVR
jgi:putative ABC transport system substrate-binding protein